MLAALVTAVREAAVIQGCDGTKDGVGRRLPREGLDDACGPIRVNLLVLVDEGHDLAARVLQAAISRT